jgi:mannan endo-1,4-beta-mannosidase
VGPWMLREGRLLGWVAAWLALCSIVGVGAAEAAGAGFVTTRGGRVALNGRLYYLDGTNLWTGMNLGAAGPTGDRERLCRELARLHAAGVTNLRVMAASEGPDTEPYRMVPALQASPGVYNEEVFQGLDFLLDEMDKLGMRAVMVLNNYWHWSGGMAQYVSWADGSAIPYPNDTGDWWSFMLYAAQFYTNSQCQEWFRDHIGALVNRQNTVNGRTYRDDPTILTWELANEPRLYPQTWIDDTAAFIKSLDSNHMVTVGSEGEMGGDFLPTHDGPDIDYTTCHIWPQNWGWYDPADPATYPDAEANAVDYFRDHEDMARTDLGKPLVLEEFGLARDGWLGWDYLDPDAPTSHRDALFTALFEEVYISAAGGGAAVGDNFWAWAGEGRPSDPAPQWIGDPPHEPQGWYSVYDLDASTLAVIAAHGADMKALNPALTATVELEGYSAAPGAVLTLRFAFTDAGGALLESRDVQVAYINGRDTETVVLDTVPGDAVRVSCKEIGHFLRRRVDITGTAPDLAADFTGENKLLGGDLDNSNFVELADFAQFLRDFGRGDRPESDINGDGVVDILEFGYISLHFFQGGDVE